MKSEVTIKSDLKKLLDSKIANLASPLSDRRQRYVFRQLAEPISQATAAIIGKELGKIDDRLKVLDGKIRNM